LGKIKYTPTPDKSELRELILYLDKYKPGWRGYNIYKRTPLKLAYQKNLLKNQTDAEKRLWSKIGARQLGVTFTRQKVVIGYIVDFYSQKYKLAIELDGPTHDIHKDRVRDNALNNVGVYVLRFKNDDVYTRLDWVLNRIKDKIEDSKVRAQK
jgi:very-short-patch-repair endonuclease